jgi:hypothetical protein
VTYIRQGASRNLLLEVAKLHPPFHTTAVWVAEFLAVRLLVDHDVVLWFESTLFVTYEYFAHYSPRLILHITRQDSFCTLFAKTHFAHYSPKESFELALQLNERQFVRPKLKLNTPPSGPQQFRHDRLVQYRRLGSTSS